MCTHVAFQGGLFDSFEIDIHVGVGGVAIVRVQGHLCGYLFGEGKPRIFANQICQIDQIFWLRLEDYFAKTQGKIRFKCAKSF